MNRSLQTGSADDSPRPTATRRLRENWLLGLMLLLLHAALWSDFGSLLSRSMMLAHLGVFLLWQPLWRRDRRLDRTSAVVFVLLTLAFVIWLNWWFVFVWLLLLIGLIGGRVLFVNRRERIVYLATLVAAICEFLIGCIVPMFEVPIGGFVTELMFYGLLAPPLLVLVIPTPPRRGDLSRSVDFLHALTLSSLSSIMALGSLLVMYSSDTSYEVALLQTLLFIALFLLAISWLLDPHPGFSGLAQLWSRYVLNVGTPFEQWLTGLSLVAQNHDTPEAFLEAAMRQFVEVPWVEGAAWRIDDLEGQAGKTTPHASYLDTEGLETAVYTLATPGATLILHGKLLLQVIAYFYSAKRAQQELARRAHLQAVYETGARVTHDIKNLLQSLHTLTTAVSHLSGERAADAQRLLEKQLPHLTQRLHLALEKLQSPAEASGPSSMAELDEWWRNLKARHAADPVVFTASAPMTTRVPVDCFDSVVENLLENARLKRQTDADIQVRVFLEPRPAGPVLRVCDSGNPVAGPVAKRLFREPIASSNGLGIGLYQAASQASRAGYRLFLADNRHGSVCFELSPGEDRE